MNNGNNKARPPAGLAASKGIDSPRAAFGLTVSPEESGMKLLRFLERRLPGTPGAALHKWIRTGQVRVNGRRAKPFQLLAQADLVRVPPFALEQENSGGAAASAVSAEYAEAAAPASPGTFPSSPSSFAQRTEEGCPKTTSPLPHLGPDLPAVGCFGDILILNKPNGLAVQPGTGVTDCVADRLRTAWAGRPYVPAPAHRLDKESSGLLAAGLTHAAQKFLHLAFQTGEEAGGKSAVKIYLAVCAGRWPYAAPRLLADTLRQEREAFGFERVAAAPGGLALPLETSFSAPCPRPDVAPPSVLAAASSPPAEAPASLHRAEQILPLIAETGFFAEKYTPWTALPPFFRDFSDFNSLCIVRAEKSLLNGAATLLSIRLITGRKHQIRAQLASRGHPIVGDARFNGPKHPILLLHAAGLALPPREEETEEERIVLTALPKWEGEFAVKDIWEKFTARAATEAAARSGESRGG